jgi:hypothetical protein
MNPLIFLHIPKAAGATFRQIILYQYGPKVLFDRFKNKKNRNIVYKIDDSNVALEIQKFKNLPLEVREKIILLYGHMDFGLHEYLPNPSSYITMLRDPVDRIISHYYFVLSSPTHYLYKTVKEKNLSLKEYVTSGISKELDNCQTRHICGLYDAVDYGKCTDEMLNIAKRNLNEYFKVIGIQERFDESLVLMQSHLNWRLPIYTKLNITKNKPSRNSLTLAEIDSIKENNLQDISLYNYVKEKFVNEIKELGDQFQKKLSTFKIINKAYQNIYPYIKPSINKIEYYSKQIYKRKIYSGL